MQLQLIFLLVMALILLVFTFQNPYPVKMHFMGWQTEQVPMIIVVIISVLVGVLISLLLGIKRTKELKRNIRQLQKEIDELKMPRPNTDEDEF